MSPFSFPSRFSSSWSVHSLEAEITAGEFVIAGSFVAGAMDEVPIYPRTDASWRELLGLRALNPPLPLPGGERTEHPSLGKGRGGSVHGQVLKHNGGMS